MLRAAKLRILNLREERSNPPIRRNDFAMSYGVVAERPSRETRRGICSPRPIVSCRLRRMLMNLSDPRTTSALIDREISPICMHHAFGFLCRWKPVVSGDPLLGRSFYGFCLGQRIEIGELCRC